MVTTDPNDVTSFALLVRGSHVVLVESESDDPEEHRRIRRSGALVARSWASRSGANQVSIISSTTERQAAIEFAKAHALRPQIVGKAFQKISEDPELAETPYTILDLEKMRASDTRVTLIPECARLLTQLLAAQPGVAAPVRRQS